MAFKVTVADPKSKKTYQRETGGEGLAGKKIGDKFSGSSIGLDGYELEITGGSDKDGFPMRGDVDGTARKKVLLSGGAGFNPKVSGLRKRKSVRGNTISADIVQINTKVVKQGSKPLAGLMGPKPGEKEEKAEAPKGEPSGVKPIEKPDEGKPGEKGEAKEASKEGKPAEGQQEGSREGKPEGKKE